jgi:hypothetical protein
MPSGNVSGIAASPRVIWTPTRTPRTPTAVVAIPARDEADRIGRCLQALALQSRHPDAVLLLLNNCNDLTETIARNLSAALPFTLHIVCHTFPPAEANAGNARRLAMRLAAERAGPDGVLLTTDADCVVANDWVERNLRSLAAGTDLVCGRVEIDPVEATLIPPHLHADDALEQEFSDLLDRIAFVLDPTPADPWPRHTHEPGASIGVTVEAFTRSGGIPPIATGEDRAFVQLLARMDARIRHDPAIRVTASGRIVGRAAGGMADTIRRRIRQQDEFADDRLEPAVDAYRRADFRRRARLAWCDRQVGRIARTDLAADLGIQRATLLRMLGNAHFGAAWAEIEAATPFLPHRRVRFAELPRQIAYARELQEHIDSSAVHVRPNALPDPTASGRPGG